MLADWKARTPETKKVKEAILTWNNRIGFSIQDIMLKAGTKRATAARTIQYLYKQGILDRPEENLYFLKDAPKTPEQSCFKNITFNALEVGESIIILVENLKKKIQELEDENKTLTDISEDYDRLAQDNRVLQERVTELSTRYSASNLKQLKL